MKVKDLGAIYMFRRLESKWGLFQGKSPLHQQLRQPPQVLVKEVERLRERFRRLADQGQPEDGVLFPELQPLGQADDQPPGCVVCGQYSSPVSVMADDPPGPVWCRVCYGCPNDLACRSMPE